MLYRKTLVRGPVFGLSYFLSFEITCYYSVQSLIMNYTSDDCKCYCDSRTDPVFVTVDCYSRICWGIFQWPAILKFNVCVCCLLLTLNSWSGKTERAINMGQGHADFTTV